MPAVTSQSATGNAYVNGVLGDLKWASSSLTFSFPTQAGHHGSGYGNGETANGFAPLSAAQQAAARTALGAFAAVANFSFTEIAETATQEATLRLAMSNEPSTAWAYMPTTLSEGGDVWFNRSNGYYGSPTKGNYAFTTFLHEIGHALGLEHAHEHHVMPADRDSMEYTVMSYRSFVGASTSAGYGNESWGYAQSLMMYDIAAVQHLYGANYNTNAGATNYSWSPTTGEMFVNGVGQGAPGGNRIFQTVWDGGGNDTYDFSNYAGSVSVDLQPGEWSTVSAAQTARLHYDGSRMAAGNIANALLHQGDTRSLIENAIGGAGGDSMAGNAAGNVLEGRSGSDTLEGFGGNDWLFGGAGGDTAYGGIGSDVIYGGSSTADPLDAGDTLHGEAGNDRIYGNGGADRIYGGGDTDVVYGGYGNDTVYGGAGVGDPLDVSDTLYGNEGSDSMFGNGGADQMFGGADADILYGGFGNDTLYGGAGISDPFDVADTLHGNEGDDLIFGNGGADQLFGDANNDTIYGGAGDDIIRGGAGFDVLIGNENNDTFVFARGEANGDTIQDFSGNGSGLGDVLSFVGYGAATLVLIDATHLRVVSAFADEVITLANAAAIDASDFSFA